MRRIHTLTRRAAALCLTALLVLPAFAAEPSEAAAKRQEDLDFLYHEVLEQHHPNMFANTPEAEFLALKSEIEGRLETESDEEFLLDLMSLTALIKDSHTSLSIGNVGQFRLYPFSMVRRGDSWYLSAVSSENADLLCQEVTLLAGKPVAEVIDTCGTLFSSDNPVHLQRQFRSACNIADIYEYLGLVEPDAPLTVTLKKGGTLSLEPQTLEAAYELDMARLADQITGEPETAGTDANYASKALTDSVYYIEYNVCREDEDLPMEDFVAQVAEDLEAGEYSRVLLDLRSNGGGSDGVIWPLFEVLRGYQYAGYDFELVSLIGESTFSSALINAVEIQEMGGVLAGEDAGGSVSHFGAVGTFSLPNSGARGQISSKYIDLNTLLDAGAGRGVVALEPDVKISQTLEDTLNGRDTLVDWLLAHPETLSPKEYPDAPLTRGRFVGLLYAAAGSPAVTIEGMPFSDCLGGIEWYCPALVWAKKNGIALGRADGTFAAARPVTWREAAVLLARTAEALGAPEPEPSAGRSGPIPAALASGWEQEAVTRAWDWGLLPAGTDMSQDLTRAQGKALADALGKLLAH